ncbi:hypothetical protein N1031_05385 [Herbiconiux moechotypicola]|uniref:DUF732 domain-containing protein n=1 Tax=Herbiconiux moechotypicola TaxID=637393 RepID=A0ABP5Q865_9MICO|nr:hypothetical protein [Herbiconiux moechotypicola]MCS5729188.1 hypothetical protein [Herbiconiux moechotypicola]
MSTAPRRTRAARSAGVATLVGLTVLTVLGGCVAPVPFDWIGVADAAPTAQATSTPGFPTPAAGTAADAAEAASRGAARAFAYTYLDWSGGWRLFGCAGAELAGDPDCAASFRDGLDLTTRHRDWEIDPSVVRDDVERELLTEALGALDTSAEAADRWTLAGCTTALHLASRSGTALPVECAALADAWIALAPASVDPMSEWFVVSGSGSPSSW